MKSKLVVGLVLILVLAVPAVAQQMKKTTKDFTPMFRSMTLLANVSEQAEVDDNTLILAGIASGDIIALGMGHSYTVLNREGTLLLVTVKGHPGVWYTITHFLE